MSQSCSSGEETMPFSSICQLATKPRYLHSRPLHYQWDLADPNAQGTCIDFNKFFIGKGIANVCLNFLVFVLVSSLSECCHWR